MENPENRMITSDRYRLVYVEVPYSLIELEQWKTTVGKYKENPDKVATLVEWAINSQNPDWADLNSMLDTLLDPTERRMVNKAIITSVKLGKHWVTHQFLYMPNSPKPLLGRDLLEKLEAEIKFEKEKSVQAVIPEPKFVQPAALFIQEKLDEIPAEVGNVVNPIVWASDIPGRSKRAEPVSIALKTGATPVRRKQYPLKSENCKGLAPVIEKFLQHGLLVQCESKFNTTILAVKKADGKSCRLVQDLRAINKIAEDIHPVVANPYTLLTTLTDNLGWFTVIDLKDAFFCIPVHKNSQKLFAFERENSKTGRKTQLTWSVLPQGFKNSPTISGNQLAKELVDWRRQEPEGVILQYVDDILIATKTRDHCI
ncbi:hypothetical protein DUI87_01868 [Hirundo rustica rustica]|uniref:ribonuclease H n=1 Tax=Hirundo rustica rustica TaxID=333673 RepID=A0A3M0L5S0_HIRRU|nr:hypothetical protein DUI87_01868 [Hirundo rustica rustica]